VSCVDNLSRIIREVVPVLCAMEILITVEMGTIENMRKTALEKKNPIESEETDRWEKTY
jgi:hypothetical protein